MGFQWVLRGFPWVFLGFPGVQPDFLERPESFGFPLTFLRKVCGSREGWLLVTFPGCLKGLPFGFGFSGSASESTCLRIPGGNHFQRSRKVNRAQVLSKSFGLFLAVFMVVVGKHFTCLLIVCVV